MTFTYTIPFARPVDEAWIALADTERLIRCLPGCEAVERADEIATAPEPPVAGVDVGTYRIRVAAGLGPVRLRGAGTAVVQRNPSARSLTAKVSLADPRAGAMYGTMTLEVRPAADGGSELHLAADVVLASKMGEFAQPLVRRKADQTARQFAQNLAAALDARGNGT